MNTNLIIRFIFITSFFNFSLLAEGDHGHHHKPLEFGFSIESVNIEEEGEDENVAGIHAHVIRKLTSSKNEFLNHFGLGLGTEVLFADEEHYSLMFSLAYYPADNWAVLVSPGYEFAKHDGETEEHFSMHYELTYTKEFKHFHAGPVLSFSKTSESKHLGIGLHFGF